MPTSYTDVQISISIQLDCDLQVILDQIFWSTDWENIFPGAILQSWLLMSDGSITMRMSKANFRTRITPSTKLNKLLGLSQIVEPGIIKCHKNYKIHYCSMTSFCSCHQRKLPTCNFWKLFVFNNFIGGWKCRTEVTLRSLATF